MTLTLRTRLALGSTLVFGLLVGGVSVVTYQVLARWLDADATDRVVELARGLHGYLRVDPDRAAVAAAPDDADQATFVHDATQYFQVYDVGTGRLLAESPGLAPLGLQLTPPEVASARQRQAPLDIETDFGRFRFTSSSGVAGGSREYLLQVGTSLRSMDATLARYRTLLWWRVPGLVMVGGLVFWWFAGVALAPLSRVAAATETVTIANLAARLPVRGVTDELDLVASAFNRTLSRLEASVSDMRQFSTALAHELRTPLAGLRGQIELALRMPDLPAAQRESLASQIDELDRLTRLITHILTLARAESGQIALQEAPVELNRLAADTVDALDVVAEAERASLRVDVADAAVWVRGDAGWLGRVVLNLVDNAIKYSTPPATVVVRVRRDGDTACLEVQDAGIGMANADAAQVFNPFFRADPARSRPSAGAGLGLSLVRWVVTAHGGTVDVASVPGAGSTFRVRLPLVPPAPRST